MNQLALRSQRESAGLSLERLAHDLGVSVAQVERWESGAARLPKHRQQEIEWLLALSRNERLLDSSGLPECSWLKEWEQQTPADDNLEQMERRYAELEQHSEACDVCRRRDEFVRRHARPLPPYPRGSRWQRLAMVLLGVIRGLWDGKGAAPLIAVLSMVVLAYVLRLTPHWDGFLVIVYPLSLLLASTVGVRLYQFVLALIPNNAVTRWLARCVGGVAGCWAFVAVYLISNYTGILSRSGAPMDWPRGLGIATIMGLVYATFWPLAAIMHRSRGA